MQRSVKETLRATNQLHTVQPAKVQPTGYRSEEMKDTFRQRELRMEVQMAELSTKMYTLSTAAQSGDQPKVDEPTTSDAKLVLAHTPGSSVLLKASPKTSRKHPNLPKRRRRLRECTCVHLTQ